MKNSNKGAKYDKMVREKSDDELGLFDQYEDTFIKIRDKITRYNINSIIDFGCGTGNLCGPLSEKINVIGIDKSYEMIQEGKRKYPKMNFIQSSIFDVSNIKERADIVVSSYVLHGLIEEKKQKALSNMLLLNDQKRVILIDFMFENMKSKEEYKESLLRHNRADLWAFIESKNFFIVEELKNYIEKLNLKIALEHAVNFTWIAEICKK
ncbi:MULTISPECIES: class I SAM-dependent methyltransferase [Clostridium]|uniref:class I SAM-dependent methyltransferase n=1 Tax=Clostridium TaxID=1485 RepID=UPI0008271007|nr:MULTISPECIES: class I SAM-dependent methyltransferase [Clostridium]PJI07407.1 class I SAM-dependent methyltransferase [Clostridium sp. CT7]